MENDNGNVPKPERKRGLTSVTLHWIAEKLRRTAQIKDELAKGTYQVDSNKVAQAILNSDNQTKH